MAHSSEIRWVGVAPLVSGRSADVLRILSEAEEMFSDLAEVYAFVGGTDQLLADQLFREDIAGRGESVANTEELGKATDIRQAVQVMHELYEAMTNVAVTQADRAADLRRMS